MSPNAIARRRDTRNEDTLPKSRVRGVVGVRVFADAQFVLKGNLWYNLGSRVLLCTRFPTPPKWGTGVTDHSGNLSRVRSLLTCLLAALLLAFASWQEGVATMISTVAIELAVHFVIMVGSRVQGRT
jgi:hypothetical protein